MQFTSFARTAATVFTLSFACVLPAQAALEARDIGNTGTTNAFYDTTLNVTWLDLASGPLSWANANTWASNLNIGGVTGWRLPTMTVATPTQNSSEMRSLFFSTLGNNSPFGVKNKGDFQNLQSYDYWLGTEYAISPSVAWSFNTDIGNQLAYGKSTQLDALAVHSGDVMAPVPEPETYAMMLAGLALIGAIGRRRSRAAAALAV
jgi:hypothetical protein